MVILDAEPTPLKIGNDDQESVLSSVGNSPPVDGRFSVLSNMEKMLKTQESLNPDAVKTVKAFKIRPNVIYLKNTRDQMLAMTEKEKNLPEDEHGYWGGFSPTRKGRYENMNLSKRHADGRARIYPARKANSTYQSTLEPKDIPEDNESGHDKG